jgi:hypothetical protein
MITKGDKHIGRFIYLRCESEFSDAVNDLRQTNNAGYIKFERCTVANAVKGAGTWVEDLRLASLLNERVITKESTGFTNCENVIVTYNSTTRKVTLTGTFEAYYLGEKITALVNGWESAAHADVHGLYFLRYCETGFEFTTTPWTFDCLQIAFVNYNTFQFGIRETHGFMQWESHRELHDVIGTYRTAGGGLTGVVLNSTTAAERRPDVAQTTVQDEDLKSVINALSTKQYTQRYLSGATPTRLFNVNAADIIPLNGNVPYYNQNVGGTWQQTPIPNNNYAKLFYVAVPVSNDAGSQSFRYMWVQPQFIGTLLQVQAITTNSYSYGDSALFISEFVFVGEVIINVSGNNWRIYSTALLSGTKLGQIASPTGNYLTAVTHDTTLTGSGVAGDPLGVTANTFLKLDQSTPQTQTQPQIITSLVKGKLTYTDSNGQMKEIDAVYDPVKLQIQIGTSTAYSNSYGLVIQKNVITDGEIRVGGGGAIFNATNLNAVYNGAYVIKNTSTGANSSFEIWTKNTKAATFTPSQDLQVVGNVTGANLSGTNTGDNATNSQYSGLAASKQDTLVSATNIKTINGDSILGAGNLVVTGAAGEGVPTGGTTGQILAKNSNTDYDTEWIDPTSGGGTSLWTAIVGTRASNTSFTVGSDITTFATKGLIFKWTESNVVRCAMTTSSSFSSPNTTVNIVGDTMASIDSGSLKYTFMPHQKYEWKLAGSIGATGTNVAQIHYVREPMRVLGAEISTNVAGTTNSTTVNIINSNGTVTVVSPSLATTVVNNTTVTAPATSGLSLAINDKLTENIGAIQTTPCVDLYVDLLVFPTRFLNLT